MPPTTPTQNFMPASPALAELMEEFEREFVKDLGGKIEPVWLDPNGCVGPVRQFLAKVYTTARRQALTDAIEAMPEEYEEELNGTLGYVAAAIDGGKSWKETAILHNQFRAEAIAKLTQLRDV